MANRGSSLAAGSYLATNDYLCSANGSHFAIMQSDGNLVIYHGNGPTNQGAFLWNSGVAPGGDPHFFAIMQTDGNLSVYRGSDPLHKGAFVWNNGANPGYRGAPQFVATLQNDGNLVITTGAPELPPVVWSAYPLRLAKVGPSLPMGRYLATNDYLCSADGSHFAIMQSDGNLVVYRGRDPMHQGAFLWNSGVAPGGDPHFFAIMQNDGNLVVYRGSDPMHQGAFVWNSGVAPGDRGAPQYVATLQNDGNLVLTMIPLDAADPPIVAWSAQPIPSIVLTIKNQMESSLTVSLFDLKRTKLQLHMGESGSLPLLLNMTTKVEYQYLHTNIDPSSGVVETLQSSLRTYTVATSDTTHPIIMIVTGGSVDTASLAKSSTNPPIFTETLPSGVTASWVDF